MKGNKCYIYKKDRRTNRSEQKGKVKPTVQELEDLEIIQIEKLLQSVQTLEESLQDLPSIEDHLAEVERLTEQMERELEEYLNE